MAIREFARSHAETTLLAVSGVDVMVKTQLRLLQRRLKFSLAILMTLLCGCSVHHEDGPVTTQDLRSDIEAIANARVFFGHQSVGRNILEGVGELAASTGVTLPVVRLDGEATATGKGLVHTDIGQNNDPLGKIGAFGEVLNGAGKADYDAAILKFCYVDLSSDGMKDPDALLEQYSRKISALRAAHPGLRIIHATVPLRSDPLEWKTPIKRLLGWETYEDADNRLRNRYNAGLRKRFAGEAIFDIAEIESTRPDGSRSGFSDGRDTIYTLAREYTVDGGHLNAIGRQVVARAFIRTIAKTLGQEK